jgi:rare lipoprotein A (peptidoglycan hydrolase)
VGGQEAYSRSESLMKRVLLGSAIALFVTMTMLTNASASLYSKECIASWYGPGLQGNLMANGDEFDMNDPKTVASKELKMGTVVRIINLRNRKSIIAIVRDHGPHVDGRCIDVSKKAAILLGFLEAGITDVRVEVVG